MIPSGLRVRSHEKVPDDNILYFFGSPVKHQDQGSGSKALPAPGGSEEDEVGDGVLGVAQACSVYDIGVNQGFYRRLLPHDTVLQRIQEFALGVALK